MSIRWSWGVDRGRYKLLLPLRITRESELPGTHQPSFIRLSTFLSIYKNKQTEEIPDFAKNETDLTQPFIHWYLFPSVTVKRVEA